MSIQTVNPVNNKVVKSFEDRQIYLLEERKALFMVVNFRS